MFKIKPIKQSKPGFCGPASLKTVLDFYDLKYSESFLGKILKTTKEKGTDEKGFKNGLKKLRLKFLIKSNSSLKILGNFLEKKIPVIVDWFSEDDGHYSVVVGLNKNFIFLADPEIGKIRKIDLKIFKRIWFDFPENKIKMPKDLILRWLLAVFPPKIK